MDPVSIQPVPDDLRIKMTGDKIVLSPELRKKVDDYWRQHTADKPSYFNGEVFTITNLELDKDAVNVELAETDYAHHFYTAKIGDLGKHNTRTIHPTCLVITTDDKMIFGKMGNHTGRAGLIQCCGGGMDNADVKGDGTVDITDTAARELTEELGIDVSSPLQVKAFGPHYLTTGGKENKMSVVFLVHITKTAEQFQQAYQQFITTNPPEFAELYYVPRTIAAAEDFLTAHEGKFSEEVPVILRQAVQ